MKSRRALYVAVVLIGATIVGASLVVYLSRSSDQEEQQKAMTGSLFVSDAGRSHGGFEYNAEWNATLALNSSTAGGDGTLNLALNAGLGDALTKHNFTVTGFSRNDTQVTMLIDGQEVVMEWISNDSVWNGTYDNHYIASWGSDSPSNELIGKISPDIFPGLISSYYVELRLR